jgi:hypothetical protein
MPFLIGIGQWLLSKCLPWIGHQIARAWGVFLVGAVVIILAMRFHAFKLDLYNEGYKKGYSQALTDHPQYGNVGTVNNMQGDMFKYIGVDFELLGLQIKLGK